MFKTTKKLTSEMGVCKNFLLSLEKKGLVSPKRVARNLTIWDTDEVEKAITKLSEERKNGTEYS